MSSQKMLVSYTPSQKVTDTIYGIWTVAGGLLDTYSINYEFLKLVVERLELLHQVQDFRDITA